MALTDVNTGALNRIEEYNGVRYIVTEVTGQRAWTIYAPTPTATASDNTVVVNNVLPDINNVDDNSFVVLVDPADASKNGVYWADKTTTTNWVKVDDGSGGGGGSAQSNIFTNTLGMPTALGLPNQILTVNAARTSLEFIDHPPSPVSGGTF